MTWQPIKTAPKDGTKFLAIDGYLNYDVFWWEWINDDDPSQGGNWFNHYISLMGNAFRTPKFDPIAWTTFPEIPEEYKI